MDPAKGLGRGPTSADRRGGRDAAVPTQEALPQVELERLARWAEPGFEDILSVLFVLACPALLYLASRLPERLPMAMVVACSALVAYQLMFGDHKLFGTVGLAPIAEGIAFVVHLLDLGVWPMMLIIVFAAGVIGRYLRKLGAAFAGFEVGWLLSTPLYQLMSARFEWVDNVEHRGLVRQFVFVVVAVVFACASVWREDVAAFALSPLMGAYLGIAGANHLLREPGRAGNVTTPGGGDCFWPDTYFADYASRDCGIEFVEWLVLVACAALVLLAARPWEAGKHGYAKQDTLHSQYTVLPGGSDAASIASSSGPPSSDPSGEPHRHREHRKASHNEHHGRHGRGKGLAKKAEEGLRRAWRATAFFLTGRYHPGPHHLAESADPQRRRRLQAAGLAV